MTEPPLRAWSINPTGVDLAHHRPAGPRRSPARGHARVPRGLCRRWLRSSSTNSAPAASSAGWTVPTTISSTTSTFSSPGYASSGRLSARSRMTWLSISPVRRISITKSRTHSPSGSRRTRVNLRTSGRRPSPPPSPERDNRQIAIAAQLQRRHLRSRRPASRRDVSDAEPRAPRRRPRGSPVRSALPTLTPRGSCALDAARSAAVKPRAGPQPRCVSRGCGTRPASTGGCGSRTCTYRV